MNRPFHVDTHGLLKLTAEDFVGQSVAVLSILPTVFPLPDSCVIAMP